MIIESNRLVLRPWQDEDATLLYQYASDPDVGPRAGWAPHQSVEESLHIIQTVFRNPTTWAIIRKEDDLLIGAIGYGSSCDCNLPRKWYPLKESHKSRERQRTGVLHKSLPRATPLQR